MRQISIKSDRVAELLEAIVEQTGESKVDAVTRALEQRLQELQNQDRGQRTLAWLQSTVWARLPEHLHGRAPSKQEQEELLGF